MAASQSVQLSEIYRFLSQALRYPEPDWFNDIFLSLYARLLYDLDWGESQSFLVCSDQYIEALQVEYTRLFITATPHVIAPPYASVYLDGTVNGPTTLRTRQFYFEHGYELINNDLPDHLITELDFAAVLEEQGESCETFLAELFRPWFKHFKMKVLQGTTENYYKSTVTLVDFFTCPEVDD